MILEMAKKYGLKIHYEKYRMWAQVPFIGDTALVIDETIRSGGMKILYEPSFPVVITEKYVLAAIKAKAHSLGEFYYDPDQERRRFTPFMNVKGKPKGFYTHKVGEDVSSL